MSTAPAKPGARVSALYRALVAASFIGALGSGVAMAVPEPSVDPDVVDLLGGIDYNPSRSSIEQALGEAALTDLIDIAENADGDMDPGLRLRALRALGEYGTSSEAELASDTLRRSLTEFSVVDRGKELLYLRTAMLSLARVDGVKSVNSLMPLLGHPSRDVRAAAARSLAMAGEPSVIPALRERALLEEVEQVQVAIDDAIFALGAVE